MVPGQGGRALAVPAAVPPARRAGRARTASAPASSSASPRSLVAELTGTTRRRPVGARTRWSGRCSTVVDASAGEPWARTARAPTSATAGRARRASCGAGAATPSPGGWPACSRRTPRSGPPLLADWARGRRHRRRRRRRSPDDLAWQPELWRPLVAEVGAPDARTSGTPASLERAARASRAPTCRRGSRCSGTPGSRSPRSSCSPRSATHRDVHLWLPHPSARALGARWPTCRRRAAPRRRLRTSGSATRCSPPSAATCASCSACARHAGRAPTTSALDAAATGPTTLLAWLQADIAANAVADPPARDARRRRPLASRCTPATARPVRSRCCARCCSACSPTTRPLEPRDILVMCPDIEAYAPLIAAAFGIGEVVAGGHPGHQLRVRLADRALTQTNPLLGVVGQLLDLAGGRAEASRVLDLAQRRAGAPPLRVLRRRPRDDHRLGASRPASAGRFDAGAPRRRSGSRATSRTPGGSASTGCSPASRCPTTPSAGSARRCRSTTSAATSIDLAGRLAELRRPAAATSPTGSPAATRSAHWLDALRDGHRRAHRASAAATSGRSARCSASSPGCSATPAPGAELRAAAARRARADGRAARRPPDPGQLPHRHADRLHDGADALGAAPGGLPARPRRRRLPARSAPSTATTCSPATR